MADLTLAVTGVSSTGQVASIGAPGLVALTLPTPRLAISVAGVVLTLPVPRLSISGMGAVPSVQLTLPVPTLVCTGTAGASGDVALTLPSLKLSISALPAVVLTLPTPTLAVKGFGGAVGAVALALPAPVLSVAGPNSATLTLPTPTLQITGGIGVIGGVQLNLRAPQLTIAGQVPYIGQAALVLPAPQLTISGSPGVTGSVSMTMRALALAIKGHSGAIGRAVLTLPVTTFSARGYENVSGTVQLVLPHLQLVATGSQSAVAPASTASNTIAMHTESMGLSTYSNFPFNSFAAFNGVYLAASPAGIFTLGGATDNGALIQAAARVGVTDFASSYLKRVDRIYVGYRTDGNLVLRIFTDEINQRDYLLTATGKAGLHGNHARLGKGLTARYWQFEVRNQAGADFQLNAIELKPTPLKRRVGGGDA